MAEEKKKEEVESHSEPKTEEEILEYWTEERLKGAAHLPLPNPAEQPKEGGGRPPQKGT